MSSLLEEEPDICRLQVGTCSLALQVRSLRGRLSRGRGTGNAATGRCRRTRGTCSANAVHGCKRASVTRRRGSKALDNGAQTQSASDQRHLIQGRAAAALSESWAHRRRRDSERQENWRLEHQQREPAQRLRARLRRWDLQRRVLSVPLQSSTRDRSGSASEARVQCGRRDRAGGALTPERLLTKLVAQGCGCEAAITGMSCKPVH
jgi:hypothetical protein